MIAKAGQLIKKGRRSISVQVVCWVWIFTIPICVLYCISMTISLNAILEQTEKNLMEVVSIHRNQLDESLSMTGKYLYSVSQENMDMSLLAQEAQSSQYMRARINLINTLYNYISIYETVDGIYFYIDDDVDGGLAVSSIYSLEERNLLWSYLFDNKSDLNRQRYTVFEFNDKNWLTYSFHLYGITYGVIINLSDWTENIYTNLQYETAQIEWENSENKNENSKYVNISVQSAESGLWINILIERSEIVRSMPLLQRIGYWIAVLSLIFSFVPVVMMHRAVVRPLDRLNQTILDAKSGNIRARISESARSDEFQTTYVFFNEMMSEIGELKSEKYERELAAKDLEIENLQLQIRPHFLLNTFNLLYSLSAIGDLDNVQKLILYLSDYFRHIFRSGTNKVPFESEKDLIYHYLEVVAISYPNMLQTEIDVENGLENLKIPPLLVHNFVENVVQHALDPERTVHLTMTVTRDGNCANICIRDDGAGIPEDQVQILNNINLFPDDDRIHVGLRNSFSRIKSIYGESALISIESVYGKETCITIRLPIEDM